MISSVICSILQMVVTGMVRINNRLIISLLSLTFVTTACVGVDGGPLEFSAAAKLAVPGTVIASGHVSRPPHGSMVTASMADSSTSVTETVNIKSPQMNNELGKVLGFELVVPDEATVTVSGGGAVASLQSPYSVNEATDFITTRLKENGFTLVNETQGNGDEYVYIFQQGGKWVSITIVPMKDDHATINFSVTE